MLTDNTILGDKEMGLTDEKKTDVLLHFIDQNRKQAEWVKNLDFRIVYYCLGGFVALIGWFLATPPQRSQFPFLVSAIVFLTMLSLLFLLRNHSRHHSLNVEFRNILAALRLTEPNYYGTKPICEQPNSKMVFHFGRGIYSAFIVCGAILTISFIISVDQKNLDKNEPKYPKNKMVAAETNSTPRALSVESPR